MSTGTVLFMVLLQWRCPQDLEIFSLVPKWAHSENIPSIPSNWDTSCAFLHMHKRQQCISAVPTYALMNCSTARLQMSKHQVGRIKKCHEISEVHICWPGCRLSCQHTVLHSKSKWFPIPQIDPFSGLSYLHVWPLYYEPFCGCKG